MSYTIEQIQAMQDAAPLNKDKAAQLAADFGVPVRSVIAKAAREKIPYEKVQQLKKKGDSITKSHRVEQIAYALKADEKQADALATLEKASVAGLAALAALVGVEEQTEE